jgi:hypothetical protein
MKKLLLITNDYPGAGKSTVIRLLRRYLTTHKVAHQFVVLDECPESIEPEAVFLNPVQSGVDELLQVIDQPGITVMEAASGMGEVFLKMYEQHDLYESFQSLGIDVTVVLPVNNESESFEAVTDAAEVFSDTVQYLIAHSTTSSYLEDSSAWDSSYAARVMDMFEAVELRFPEASIEMEQAFRMHHTYLAPALMEADPEATYGKDCGKWLRRAIGQIETARQYLFGDHFRSLAEPDKPSRKPRAKKKEMAVA